ncbi:hypothetical protein [Mangrovicoccus ximenensis]|uniref:hypothetical protein n=1 Tax=Mangrovicoccus ximenensis TaxID=1911570 RepID=UPI000D360977|nr:hypothetical protein [Mangrovicoccus ximenensis]
MQKFLTLPDIFRRCGIAPADVNVILNSPGDTEMPIRRALLSVARNRPDAFREYQSSHGGPATRALLNGRRHVASFGLLDESMTEQSARQMILLGFYEKGDPEMLPVDEIRNAPEMRWFQDAYGFRYAEGVSGEEMARFDLRPAPQMDSYLFRLICLVRLTPSYVRKGENLEVPVSGILDEPGAGAG